MAIKYASVAGAGAKTGADWANAYDNTQVVGTALPAIGAGGTLYIEADTYNITAAWVLPGAGCTVVAVNASSHVEDGSRAVLNAGGSYNSCINGSATTMSQVRNIDATATTFIAIYLDTSSAIYNCIGRNSTYGMYAGSIVNCLAYSNTYGFFPNIGSVSYSESRNNTEGVTTAASVVGCVLFGNGVGAKTTRLVSGSVIDDNTVGVENSSVVTTMIGNSLTNNGTAINCNSGAFTIESKNLYKSNTTKFGGTTANIISLGGSVDSSIDPYNDQPTEDYSPSEDAEMINTAFPVGTIDETINISYLNAGLNPTMPPPSMTVTDINPASGGVGTSVTITGTNFTGSGNIVKFGGSGGTSATITAESATSITATVPSVGTGVTDIYIENGDGANLVVPNGYTVVSTAVPVCAGIVSCEIISNNKFVIKGATATNSPDYWVIYISTTTNPFASGYSFKVPYVADKYITIGTEANHLDYLVGGTDYYFGMRAENSVGEDTNTAELVNKCSGSEYNQRMNIVSPVISL